MYAIIESKTLFKLMLEYDRKNDDEGRNISWKAQNISSDKMMHTQIVKNTQSTWIQYISKTLGA